MSTIKRALIYLQRIPDREKLDPVSSVRLCWFLLDNIKFDAVWHHGNPAPDPLPDEIEELWFVASSWAFLDNDFRLQTYKVFPRANRVVWCNNDKEVAFHSYHLGRIREDAHLVALTTVEQLTHRYSGRVLDWNKLTYQPLDRVPRLAQRFRQFYYYGSLRPGRLETFDKFFPELSKRKKLVIAAANGKDRKRFEERYPGLEVQPRVENVFDALASHAATLLLEDEFARNNYVSPPNRFYEALSAGTPMIFDADNVGAWKRYGYDVARFAAASPKEALGLLEHSGDVARGQREWQRDYHMELYECFHAAVKLIRSGSIGRIGPPETVKRYKSETIGSQ